MRKAKIQEMIDRMGELKTEYDSYVKKLRTLGAGRYTGIQFYASVSHDGVTTLLDKEAVIERLGLEWVEKHSKTSERKGAVRIYRLPKKAMLTTRVAA